MNLEIKCALCGQSMGIADWPEITPEKPMYRAYAGIRSSDDGLQNMYVHHKATKIEIASTADNASVAGAVAGHDIFTLYNEKMQEFSATHHIEFSGMTAVIVSND